MSWKIWPLAWLFYALLGLVSSVVDPGIQGQQNVVTICGRGYYLSYSNKCLPCQCNGYSRFCQDGTGICINCQNNTAGYHCERCLEGYFAEVRQGQLTCKSCACPFSISSNNFAVSCMRRGNTHRCMCQDGYAGPICERCAPGYYGNPLVIGDTCKRCNCNRNSDPNLIFSDCHNVTGHCLNCWHHTTGVNCERCAPGYYGDAIIAKNCKECHCDKCGTDFCDDKTGKCHCKAGVTGPSCSHCEIGYYGFNKCQGCKRCQCAMASLSVLCNPLNGGCRCQPGVTGLRCEQCILGYWNYTSSGCQKCNCEKGPCDPKTGECLPEPIMPPSTTVCNITCGQCIWDLIENIMLSNVTINEIQDSLQTISSGAAGTDRLNRMTSLLQKLKDGHFQWIDTQQNQTLQTESIEDDVLNLVSYVNILGNKENITIRGIRIDKETQETFHHADKLVQELSSLNILIEGMINEQNIYSKQQDLSPSEILQKMSRAELLLLDMRKLDLFKKKPLADEEFKRAKEVLRRVAQWQKKLNTTEELVYPNQKTLAEVNSKLDDLEELLQDTVRNIQQTEKKNNENLVKFQENENMQKKLMEDYGAVNLTLKLTMNYITDASLASDDVETMIKNISEFHAAVDGAAKLLNERISNLSKYDKELVLRSTEHAKELQMLANELEENLKNIDANGFVQKAIDASNVYENIVKYVEEANETVATTINSLNRAEDAIVGINIQIGYVKDKSEDLLMDVLDLQQSNGNDLEIPVKEITEYVNQTISTKDNAKKRLSEIMTQIQNIESGKTTQRLQQASEIAENTLKKSKSVLESMKPMVARTDEWMQNLNNSEYDTSAYSSAVNSAGEAVKNLNDVVPELLDKLKVVEQKRPMSNISANIFRIRELIAQTRSVASKVQISMKFNGESGVEVHPNTQLEELKAFSSISLYIHMEPEKPTQDRLIMYLGNKNGQKDYMGLAIKNDNLVYIYNLGDEDVEISLSSKPVSTWPNLFNLVKVERLGRHGKVYLTVPSSGNTAEQKFIQKGEATGAESLFDLDPENSIFFVGSVPSDFRVPASLNLPPFKGCIELATLNNDVISLYNFKQKHNMDTEKEIPCARNKFAFTQSRAANYFFDGRGFAAVNIIEKGKYSMVTRFDIEVRTVVDDALLLLMVNGTNFFILEIHNGLLRLIYDFGFSQGPITIEDDIKKLQINDARYHEISVIYHNSKKVILLVDRNHVKSVENEKKDIFFTTTYIGGVPLEILNSRPDLTTLAGFRGCVKGFKFQKRDFNLLEETGTIGIGYGCPEESLMSREAYFNGESFISTTQKISPFEKFEGGFNFRTIQSNGLFFQYSEGPNVFAITLENGAVILSSKEKKIKSDGNQYNDGQIHFLMASVTPDRCQLSIDDKDRTSMPNEGAKQPQVQSASKIYFGGSPSSEYLNLTGCISNAYLSKPDRDIEVEDFQKYSEKVSVSLYGCPAEKPPAALLLKSDRNLSKIKKSRSNKVSRDKLSIPQEPSGLKSSSEDLSDKEGSQCYLSVKPKAAQYAYQYGGIANSRQEFNNIPELFHERSHFSLSLKTHSSHGLIFYVSDEGENNFMALFLAHGRIVYMFNVGSDKLKIRSSEKYNDGLWHSVIFIREKNEGRLIIDGLKVLEDRILTADASWHVTDPFYVGGVPPGKAHKNIQINSVQSFSGCVKSLQLNGQWLSSASHTFGVTPCFESPLESGTYFSTEGGYVILDDSFNLGLKFELVFEVRPRTSSGILLHVFTPGGDYLNMHMNNGRVIVQVRNGIREFATMVNPKQSICDGRWHRIAVIRDANVVQLDVDSEVNHVVGPLNPRSLDNKAPVFIGGMPASLAPPSLSVQSFYVGCMRNFIINETPVSFSKAALVSGAVSVNSCPEA
ncbi:laminin subunit alpha-4 [Erpetoichthys calabaricus]|uniref:laminin subunit alpha-4 n=1 Tax=Erpetoichthys calabaricus TaxID=27687 RepID=UPI0022343E9B|nr:laminin subunit alpha-4 [Erpetoichthys calabaricus]